MTTTEEFDAESLLAALRNKDNNAYEYLLNTIGKDLLKFANKILHNIANAEDALCEAYTALIAKSDTIRKASGLKAWLYKTVRNNAYNILKKNSVKRSVPDNMLERLINSNGGSKRDIDELVHIKNCLAKLEPDERRVLFLRSRKIKWREISLLTKRSTSKNRTIYKNAVKKFKNFYNS